MSVLDFMYSVDIRLGELLALFLQGDDDKVYIDLYNGRDDDIIFSDIRIIDGRISEYLNRKVIGLEMGNTLGIYIDAAPSIKPQEPAHWTVDFTCSNCGCKCYPMDIDFGDYNYCPNCGKIMKEGD